jgi:hypothetical protein
MTVDIGQRAMNEVILHIGTHKTGSSSIQQSLQAFDDGHTRYARFAVNHSDHIYTAFSKHYREYPAWSMQGMSVADIDRKKEQCLEQIIAELEQADRHRLIISGEEIAALSDSEKVRLVQFFNDRNIRLKVICYVRDPLGLAVSGYQQLVQGGETGPPNLAIDYSMAMRAFFYMLPREDVIVREFRRELLKEGDVVLDFCDLIGIVPDRDKVVRLNESLSASATRLILAFNRLPVQSSGSPRLLNARNRMIKLIGNAYRSDEKLDKRHFVRSTFCSQRGARFLHEKFGIKFDMPDASDDLDPESYLSDLSGIDLGELDRILHRFELDPSIFGSVAKKLIALFHELINVRKLPAGEAEWLAAIALKYEVQSPLDAEDAFKLMALARRANPSNSFIREKLEEYRSLRGAMALGRRRAAEGRRAVD